MALWMHRTVRWHAERVTFTRPKAQACGDGDGDAEVTAERVTFTRPKAPAYADGDGGGGSDGRAGVVY